MFNTVKAVREGLKDSNEFFSRAAAVTGEIGAYPLQVHLGQAGDGGWYAGLPQQTTEAGMASCGKGGGVKHPTRAAAIEHVIDMLIATVGATSDRGRYEAMVAAFQAAAV